MSNTVEHGDFTNTSQPDVVGQPDGFTEIALDVTGQANLDNKGDSSAGLLPAQAEATVSADERRPSRAARTSAGMVIAAVPFGVSLAAATGFQSNGVSGDARWKSGMAGTSSQDSW